MKKLTNFSILIMFFSMLLSSLGWAEIIIDNSDPGFRLVGSEGWETRYNPPWPSYGNDFRFNSSGSGADQAVYTFDIPVVGDYTVYAWWPSHSVCSQNTPYTIPFSDGAVTIRANQQQNPGQWNFLATGFFEQGQYQIIISDDASGTVVVADAVRIVQVPASNNAPTLIPIGNKNVNAGELLEFTVTASDPDGDDLIYSASNLPAGATFDPGTQVFNWTPEQGQAGTYTDILFTVTDDGDPPLSDSEAITITVEGMNQPPVLNFIGNKSVHEGETLSFTVAATDPDGDALFYSANNLPSGATFDLATQEFNWSPDWQSSGEHKDLVFRVSDGNTYDEEIITIDVIDSSPLLPPTALTASYSENSVTLTWNAVNSPELAGYNIYRSTSDPGNYEKLNALTMTGTQYTDHDVQPGISYYYFVTAVDIFDQIELLSEGLQYPFEIAFNNKGETFVTSWSDGVVWRIEHDGSWSVYVSGFETASSLAFRNEDLFVTDYEGGPVYRVTPERAVYPYAETLILEEPGGLTFNANGELFVLEDFNGRIFKISEDGDSWEVFFEGLRAPGDMVLDESENIYVGEDVWEDGSPTGIIEMITPDKNKTIFANVVDPDGISFDQAGNLYVGQSYIVEVTKVMPDGSSMPAVIPDGIPWGSGVNKFGELLVALPWAGQIIKVHLSHETDISNKVSINVPISNNAPILEAIGNKTVNEGELLQFTVTASDPESDNLAYSTDNLPSGAIFDPATQVFTWTPEYDQAGTYPDVLFTVTDDGDPSLSDSEAITITVENVNRPPVLELIGDKTVNEGELLQFTVTASDPDADALTYSASNLPPGAAFDPATQVLSWTPGYNQANMYPDVVFTVTDNGAPPLNASEAISITVEDVNRPPVLDPIGNKNVNEGETLSFSVTATDPDGDNLTYSVSNLPSGATFDPITRIFNWTPEQGQAGTYTAILVTVTDDGNPALSDSEMITITVIDVNENQPPVLEPIGNKSVNEGEILSFTVTASDPDGDGLTYSAANLPSGAAFDLATQVFTWIPDYDQAGTYPDVLFTVTDDGDPPLSDSEAITITVENVNRPPVLDPIGDQNVNEGEPLSFTVTATDPDGDGLTYTASNLPAGATFDPATQVFSWTPGYDQAGVYPNVQFTVTDDGEPPLSDSEAITITVGNVNRPPVLDPIGDQSVNEGETLSFTVTATDPDDDGLTYSSSNLPSGATFDPATQVFTWTPEQGQAGTYPGVLFTVTDDGDPPLSDAEAITITVIDESENRAPVLDPIGEQSVNEGETVSFTVTASDPDGDGLTYSSGNLPSGATFDPAAQVFSWTPDYDQYGVYPNVQFTVTDDGDPSLSDAEAITITVIDESENRAPVLDPIGEQSVNEGETVSFTVTASDPDEDNLIYAASNLPSGATFDPATQVFSWMPTYDQADEYPNVLFTVTDNGAPPLNDSEAITITVEDVNRQPVLVPIGDQSVNEGETLSFTVTASDPDGDGLTYSADNLPLDAAFDPTTQIFTWTPTYDQTGMYSDILFTVIDDGNPHLSDSESITIMVENVNRPPILEPIGDKTVNEEEILQFAVTASDPDGDALTYTASNLPEGATFEPTSRSFIWTPANGQAGTYTDILFTVTDNGEPTLSDSEQIVITVQSSSPPVDIIIDNSDPEFQLVGSEAWDTRSNPPWPSYGNDFRFNLSGSGVDRAVYTFDISVAGDYSVYAWWPSHSVCSQNTPYAIPFSDGTVAIRVNQQQNPGQWNFLATGFFEQGQYQIIISDDASGTVVVADAVRIVSIQ